MESNADPITAWVRRSAAEPVEPRPLVQRPLRLRRKLATAVRDGVAEAAAILYPTTPQAREHLAALLLESDSATWPLVDGTDPVDLTAAVREWLTVADAEPGNVTDAEAPGTNHPLLVPLCAAIIEAVRKQAVRGGDDALLEFWLDFEEASGIDASRLPVIPFYSDDEEETRPADPSLGELRDVYGKRRMPSPVPWTAALAGAGVGVSLGQLTGMPSAGWISVSVMLAAIGFVSARAWASGDDERRSSDVEMLEVYEHGVVVNTASGREIIVKSVLLWTPEEGPIDHRTRGLRLVWSPREGAEPVFTDLDEFSSHRALKRALVQGGFEQADSDAKALSLRDRRPR